MNRKKAIIVSGYFNPIHKGHIELFHLAKTHGDKLFVIVNNDFQRQLKGSKKFMDENERVLILSELEIIDKVFLSIDKDKSVRKSLSEIHFNFNNEYELFFANGGDQNNKSISEKITCEKLNINLIEGLGDKIQSSSWLLKDE